MKSVWLMPAGKWAAAVTEIKLYHKQGRPVLVGTTSVERSEALAAMLKQEGSRQLRLDPHSSLQLSCPLTNVAIAQSNHIIQNSALGIDGSITFHLSWPLVSGKCYI